MHKVNVGDRQEVDQQPQQGRTEASRIKISSEQGWNFQYVAGGWVLGHGQVGQAGETEIMRDRSECKVNTALKDSGFQLRN